MKLWISTLAGMLVMFFVWMPGPVGGSEPVTVQPQVISAGYWSTDAYHHHWINACRDPRFRRHHPFLCR
jgi:hypothetical protein